LTCTIPAWVPWLTTSLRRCAAICDCVCTSDVAPRGTEPDASLLCSNNRLARANTYSAQALADNWRLLCLATGVLNDRVRPPRLHDLRHSFAVAALHRWYRQGLDVQSKLPHLATYLGHVS